MELLSSVPRVLTMDEDKALVLSVERVVVVCLFNPLRCIVGYRIERSHIAVGDGCVNTLLLHSAISLRLSFLILFSMLISSYLLDSPPLPPSLFGPLPIRRGHYSIAPCLSPWAGVRRYASAALRYVFAAVIYVSATLCCLRSAVRSPRCLSDPSVPHLPRRPRNCSHCRSVPPGSSLSTD